ncbi:MAG: hypothetical protein WCD21_44255 [Streptomyces sp.]
MRGPDCVREYWQDPELSAATFRDGWVHTGDLAWMREDGFLFLVDRMKDMIISGGFNIHCTEVEAALYEHPAVREACVVGAPDEQWGEAVKAVIVPHEQSAVTEDPDRTMQLVSRNGQPFRLHAPVPRHPVRTPPRHDPSPARSASSRQSSREFIASHRAGGRVPRRAEALSLPDCSVACAVSRGAKSNAQAAL